MGAAAFAENQLRSIDIPDSVVSIELNAFLGNQLGNIQFGGNVNTIAQGSFYSNQLTNVVIPGGVSSVGILAFHENPLLETISIYEDAAFDQSIFPAGVEIVRRKSSIVDANRDGFVDQVTNYQVLTNSGGVDLIHRQGGVLSDETSPDWDAVKAITNDASIQVLIEGTGRKNGKFRIWFANLESGVVISQSKWNNSNWMANQGYESIFDHDINSNGVIGT